MLSVPGGQLNSPQFCGEEFSGFCHCCAPARVQGSMSLRTRKRSFKRALRRAVRDGYSFYRGQRFLRDEVLKQFPGLQQETSSPSEAVPTPGVFRKKPGQVPRASRLQIFTWNAGGLSNETYDMLLSLLNHFQISVAHIQETHWSFSSTWSTNQFHCVHSGAVSPGSAGCLTLVHKDLCRSSQIKYQFVVPGRLLHVRVPLKHTFLNLINVYQHYVQNPDRDDEKMFQRQQLLHQLDGVTNSIPCRHLLLISGDFNSRLRPYGSRVGRAVGQSGVPPDEDLIAYMDAHDLVAVNTWGSTGSYSNSFANHRSQIDFVMLRRLHADHRTKQVHYVYDHPLHPPRPSYHIPMIASIASLWRCWTMTSGQRFPKPATDQLLADVATQAPRFFMYLARLREELERQPSWDLDLDSIIAKVALAIYPAGPKSVLPSVQDQVQDYVAHGWMLWKQLQKLHGRSLLMLLRGWHLAAQLQRHRRKHRKVHRSLQRERLKQLTEQAARASRMGDQRALHKIIRLLSPKQKHTKMQLRNRSGYLMTDSEEAQHILSHMRSLYVKEAAEPLSAMQCDGLPFDESHLYQSLLDIPARKSVPPGFSESAFVKHAAAVIAPVLFKRLQTTWPNGTPLIPDKWRLSWICWIPKPHKNHSSISGWRGISLQSPIGKAVLRCIDRAARFQCERRMAGDPQYAYTKGRGTGDAIARAMIHQAEALSKSQATLKTLHDYKEGTDRVLLGGGIQVCLDINQAFDRVPRKRLMESASNLGLNHNELCLLNNWHIKTEYTSPTSSENVSVDANIGVRQGCVAAPSLWNMYIHGFLETLSQIFPPNWVQNHVTVYADDFHLYFVFASETEFKMALHELRSFLDALLAYGLDLNMEKTVVLLNLKGRRASKWRKKLIVKDGTDYKLKLEALIRPNPPLLLRIVSSHKYLGIMLSYKNCQDATWVLRRNAASATFARLRRWWGSAFALRERLKLWFQTVWPTLTYGLAEVGLSQRGVRMFSGFVLRHLRILARSPRKKDCESNTALLQRLRLEDPFHKLSLMVRDLWLRRMKLSEKALFSDIIAQYPSLCQKAALVKHLLWKWWRCCLPEWEKSTSACTTDASLVMLRALLGLQETTADSQKPSPCQALARHFAADRVCPLCAAEFPHQMALRKHMRASHEVIPKAETSFRMELDALEGLPTCNHCGFRFRYWIGLKNHINNDTCPARKERAARLLALPHSEIDPSTSPIAKQEDLLLQLNAEGAQGFLDSNVSNSLWRRLAHQCCICTQWCPSGGALAYHMFINHASIYKPSRAWASRRIRNKALQVINPCRWCGLTFSGSTVLSRHCCIVAVQARILERLAKGIADDASDDDADTVDSISQPHGGVRCSKSSSGGVRGLSSAHGGQQQHGHQHGRQQQESNRRRLTGKQEAKKCKSSEGQARSSSSSRQRSHTQSRSQHEIHGSVDSKLRTASLEARRCVEQNSLRCRIQSSSSNLCSYTTSSTQNLAQVARRQGVKQACRRPSLAHLACSLLLQGTSRVRGEDDELLGRGGGVQEADCGQHSFKGAPLLQDTLGSQRTEASQSWPQPALVRCAQETGTAGRLARFTEPGSQIPQHEADGRQLHRQADNVHARAQSSRSSVCRGTPLVDGDVGDNHSGCDAVSTQEGNVAKKPFSDGAAEDDWRQLSSTTTSTAATSAAAAAAADHSMDSPLSAWRTWMQQGRGLVPVPLLVNEGNRCYRNAAVTALIVCYHHTPELSSVWGCIHDIAEAARLEWHGLLSVTSFRCSQENWPEPWLQHDVSEYLAYLTRAIPLLQQPAAEARFMTEEGVIREECLCTLDLYESGRMMQDCFDYWHRSAGVLKALLAAPPVLCIPLHRFVYDNRLLRRQPATVQLEPSEIVLPVFTNAVGIDITSVRYRCVACILHRGITPSSGHYRTLVYCDGGFVIADDDRFGEFWANPLQEDLQQVYVICLVRLSGQMAP